MKRTRREGIGGRGGPPPRAQAWFGAVGAGLRARRFALLLACAAAAAFAAEPAADDTRARADEAVRSGLRWLAARQFTEGPDAGSWETGEARYRTAVASLCGLAFLANGHLPGEGEYGAVLDRALGFVQPSMTPDGYLGQGDRSGMYLHAMNTLFGLSYLGMARDPTAEPELAAWCRRSVALILEAQKASRPDFARGGWRYTPQTDESDVSVTSWQLLVLHAARQCGIEVEDDSLEQALRFLDRAFVEPDGAAAGFVYRPGISQTPEPAATGAALFIKSLLEREPDARGRKALALLQQNPPAWGGKQYGGYFFFSAFYLTQGMFQLGEPAWSEHSSLMRTLLVEHQAGDGRWPNPPDDVRQNDLAGPAYPTAMAILILSLEKQYLPMYQRQKRLF